jgi:TRAP-type C4-dicarboxylate transport system permease small subunit
MRKLYNILSDSFENLSSLFLVGVLFAVVLQVFFRYVAGISVPWTEESARYLGIWMVFMGAAAAIAREAHIKITFILERFPKRMRVLFELFIDLIMLLFSVIVLFGSFELIRLNWDQEAVTFPVSVGVLYVAIAVSSGLTMIFLIFLIGKKVDALFTTAEHKDKTDVG